jgi:Arc/MetJ-type ribon-helix-helix transcriptional regulator
MGRTERAAPADEKITINVGPVDLGSMDVLVQEGFYGSRTDLIRTAIRRLLDSHRKSIDDAIVRKNLTVGVVRFGRSDLERLRRKNERLDLRVVGVLQIADDVSPELADAVIERISVLGSWIAPAAVKAKLAARTSPRKESQ